MIDMPTKYICSEVALSRVLFGNRDEILRRFRINGIKPHEFGLQNIEDLRFIRVVPELTRCILSTNPRTVREHDILQVIPDTNVETNERHSILVERIDDATVTYSDDTGTYTISRDVLTRWWDRAGRVFVRCTPVNGCEMK